MAVKTRRPADDEVSETETQDSAAGEASETEAQDSAGGEASETETPARKRDPKIEPPADVLAVVEDVPEEEWGSHALVTTAAVRSAGQQIIDGQVGKLKEQWEAAGRPVPDPRKSPRSRRTVSPDIAPAIRRMLGLAASYHKVAIAYFDTGHTSDGNEVLVYTLREAPKRGRPAKSENSETPENTESE